MISGESNSLPRLFLIRHGDTDWTDSHRHTGLTDLPLNADGEKHAATLQARLKNESFAEVFTSPLIRAQRTCELAGFGVRAERDSDLMEWNYGTFEGLTTTQIQVTHPGWTIWNATPDGGESAEQVGARVDRVIERAGAVGGDVALFAHGHVLRVLGARWVGMEPRGGRMLGLSTGSVSVLGYEREARVINLWNRTE